MDLPCFPGDSLFRKRAWRGAALRDLEPKWPVRVFAVRLILLTGCRPGEIRRSRWCEVKPALLALTDAKTGP